MRGDPVHDHADAVLMQLVDKAHKIMRRTEPRSDRIIPRDLVSPGTVIRIFAERHELHMRIMHAKKVRDQIVYEFVEIEIIPVAVLPPGERVHLIDIHGRCVRIPFFTLFQIFFIAPTESCEIIRL